MKMLWLSCKTTSSRKYHLRLVGSNIATGQDYSKTCWSEPKPFFSPDGGELCNFTSIMFVQAERSDSWLAWTPWRHLKRLGTRLLLRRRGVIDVWNGELECDLLWHTHGAAKSMYTHVDLSQWPRVSVWIPYITRVVLLNELHLERKPVKCRV